MVLRKQGPPDYLTHYHVVLTNDDPNLPDIQMAGFYVWRFNAELVAAAISSEVATSDCAIVVSCIEHDCEPTFNRYWMPAIAQG